MAVNVMLRQVRSGYVLTYDKYGGDVVQWQIVGFDNFPMIQKKSKTNFELALISHSNDASNDSPFLSVFVLQPDSQPIGPALGNGQKIGHGSRFVRSELQANWMFPMIGAEDGPLFLL